ncbi:sensor histidine kinase [Sphingomonas sp. Mn802worker]|uniref:sensor histidine kinase n=1 Tax=Sphingomonas sp. Mn802worker TaxID=629773 RepID=UPI0003A83B35|nr:ATP-binding protein [Sphingomonas sp. Mn802worker]
MAFRRRFAAQLAGRTVTLFAVTLATAVLAAWGRAPTMTLLAVLCVVAAFAWLWSAVDQGNADLARFVTALERGDLTQSFLRPTRGSHFDEAGAAYERALARLRDERSAGAASTLFAQAVSDSSPVPLLVLGPDDQVTLNNKAARELLGRAGEIGMSTLRARDPVFAADLAAVAPGTSRLSRLVSGGIPQRVSLDATLVNVANRARRIVAVRIIQPELDRAELAAQVDLVRVLTHEIMNSLTPVVSLAATADRMMSVLAPGLAPGVADAQLATAALARRAAELERFVESYKGFSETPVLKRERIATALWLEDVLRLFRASPLAASVDIDLSLPSGLPAIDGDAALLTQVMVNLLKNAAEATGAGGSISVTAADIVSRGVGIAVADTGTGIAPQLREDVFLPFFTTKRSGTGIGLSFARQIVLLHGGQIAIAEGSSSKIEMLLPTCGS